MRIPLLLPLLALLLPAASPAEPLAVHEWDARPADPRPYLGRVPHGSAAHLVAHLPGPVASASFHWQTNGMGGLWWDAPAECLSNAVSAVWTPAMDTGADEVRAFFRIEQPEGPDYSAFCHLAMLDSPGFAPNALPLPVRTLDFEAVAWTNAPWALPSDIPPAPDLSEYATTGQVASAIAAIPVPEPPDLSAYATTGLVSSLHPPFEEWVLPSIAWIEAASLWSTNAVSTSVRGDAVAAVLSGAGFRSMRLRAFREDRSGDFPVVSPLAGEWSLESGAAYATLSGDTLVPTGRSGPVGVLFEPADGSGSLRRTVAMTFLPGAETEAYPWAETTNTWRRAAGDALAALFDAVATNGPATSYRHYRGGQTDGWCGPIPDALQLYSTADRGGNPSTVNANFLSPQLADLLRCQSVGRTDYNTSGDTRPAMFIAPHFALCASHAGVSSATFCLDREAPEFRRYTFRKVADLGDLRVLRSQDAFPTNLLPAFLRRDALRRLSPSLYAAGLGLYISQHGTVHPCLVSPLSVAGWRTSRPLDPEGILRNRTWERLDRLGHDVHGGDSGRAVCLVAGGRLVPVGLFLWAGGSGESLLDPAVQEWIESVLEPWGESPLYLSEQDLTP